MNENIDLDIEVGDILLGGRYKNKRIVVKEIGVDDLGQPTINGTPILKFRIEKHLPDEKKSKKTLETEKKGTKKWKSFLKIGTTSLTSCAIKPIPGRPSPFQLKLTELSSFIIDNPLIISSFKD